MTNALVGWQQLLLLVWPASMASSTSLPKSMSAIASTASRVASPWPPDSPFSLRGVSSRGYRSCARSPVFSSLAVAAIRRGRGLGCCRCQAGTAGLPRVEDRATLRLIQQACGEVPVAFLASMDRVGAPQLHHSLRACPGGGEEPHQDCRVNQLRALDPPSLQQVF